MVILKFLKKVSAELRGETTMKLIPCRELDLPIRGTPTGFRTGALPFGGGRGQRRLGFISFSHGLSPWRIEDCKQ